VMTGRQVGLEIQEARRGETPSLPGVPEVVST